MPAACSRRTSSQRSLPTTASSAPTPGAATVTGATLLPACRPAAATPNPCSLPCTSHLHRQGVGNFQFPQVGSFEFLLTRTRQPRAQHLTHAERGARSAALRSAHGPEPAAAPRARARRTDRRVDRNPQSSLMPSARRTRTNSLNRCRNFGLMHRAVGTGDGKALQHAEVRLAPVQPRHPGRRTACRPPSGWRRVRLSRHASDPIRQHHAIVAFVTGAFDRATA